MGYGKLTLVWDAQFPNTVNSYVNAGGPAPAFVSVIDEPAGADKVQS